MEAARDAITLYMQISRNVLDEVALLDRVGEENIQESVLFTEEGLVNLLRSAAGYVCARQMHSRVAAQSANLSCCP